MTRVVTTVLIPGVAVAFLRRQGRALWFPLGLLAVAYGCANIVGLDGDYYERHGGGDDASGGAANSGGDGPSKGGSMGGTAGSPNGGSSGDDAAGSGGEPPAGGTSGDGGTGGEPPAGGTGGDTGGVSGAAGMTGGAGVGGAGAGGRGGSGGSGGSGATGSKSCGTGNDTCGPNGTSDCCATHAVPLGSFNRGNDSNYRATLSEFALDIYEVNVARMRAFVGAVDEGYTPPTGSGKNPSNDADPGWLAAWNDHLPADRAAFEAAFQCEDPTQRTWTNEPGAHERRPANCVDFYTAYAFCVWDGGRLPTDAELNYAAAGGDDQRVYPWSDPPSNNYVTGLYASYFFLGAGPYACYGDGVYGCTVEDLIFVGTKPDGNGRWDHADLAGNVYEWVQDLYAAYPRDCDDCANLTEGTQGTIRGGGFANNASLIQSDARLSWGRDVRGVAVGVRCARSP